MKSKIYLVKVAGTELWVRILLVDLRFLQLVHENLTYDIRGNEVYVQVLP